MKVRPVAEVVTEFLVEEGVRYVFGVPGGQNLFIMRAIQNHPEIEYVVARHENAAACMADGVARMTNRLGVCMVTTGPGVTNLVTGIGGARRDSSPVLVLSVNNRSSGIGRGDAQDADHVAILQEFVKYGRRVTHPSQVLPVLRDAARAALSGSPGPVHVDFVREVVEEAEVPWAPERNRLHRPHFTSVPEKQAIEAAAEALRSSERPVIWAGRGCVISRASEELIRLAELLESPVVSTYTAMGVVPTTHPHAFTVRSRHGTSLAQEVLAESDLVLAVGNRLDAVSTYRWTISLPDRLIVCDVNPDEIGRNYPVEVGLVGDAARTLALLHDELRKLPQHVRDSRRAWLDELRTRKSSWLEEHAFRVGSPKRSPVLPTDLMAVLNRDLPEDLVIVADAGNPGIWSHLLQIKQPYHYMKPVGFGNMGFSLPAAIGSQLAEPNHPVLCLIGDGSLGMCAGELETLARLGLRVVIVVLNDSAYGNIKQEQDHLFGEGFPNYGVEVGEVNFAMVAQGMGMLGIRANSAEEAAQAWRRALASDGPVLIEVPIDLAQSVFEDPF